MNNLNTLLLLPLATLITPFILWPVERFLPYPFIVEELAKGLLLLFSLSLTNRKTQLLYAILIGLLFSLSENVLYIFNIIRIGTVSFFLQRLLLTTTLHIGTTILMFLVASKDKRLLPLGITLAGIVHYFFNNWVTTL